MHDPHQFDPQAAAIEAGHEGACDSELRLLRDVFRLLPGGVTLQDGYGRLLLANDAAAAQLNISADPHTTSDSTALDQRREIGLELLRAGHSAVLEECAISGPVKQVFLTSHRPIRIADRTLLLSSSADITEQKAFEDQLFRSAFYDELTDLPSRRVIEHRVNSILTRQDPHARFALAFLDPPYGRGLGETALTRLASGGWLAPGAVVVFERGVGEPGLSVPGYASLDVRDYGAARVHFLRFGGA